jgi:acetyl/propionyl-CoA carboxylase alpha subunit
MPFRKLLIANRGEIAVRIARTAHEHGIEVHTIYSVDDRDSAHVRHGDESTQLSGVGPAAYLDIDAIIATARLVGADAVHPGYGFLSENASFASACAGAGLTFIGPSVEVLERFGDKAAARALADALDVPVMRGTTSPITLEEAGDFLESLGAGEAMMLKAVAGGGGRGMRSVVDSSDLPQSFARCQSEALTAFGNGNLYAEQLLSPARHIEVQVIGDAHGNTVHAWDRDCSVQRRRQKLIEIAPAPNLSPLVRNKLLNAAVRLAEGARLDNIATMEFLVRDALSDDATFAFIECNARIQVEHTVTEEITGLDLVAVQLRLAAGESLKSLDLAAPPPVRGDAIQLRVNAERTDRDGLTLPTSGRIEVFTPATGKGIRVDGYAYSGYQTNPRFDSLLAKLIVHSPTAGFKGVCAKAAAVAAEFDVRGLETNLPLLRVALRDPILASNELHTGSFDECVTDWVKLITTDDSASTSGHVGARVDANDPLAVLDYGKAVEATQVPGAVPLQASVPGTIDAPMQGTIVTIEVEVGQNVGVGEAIVVMEAMKMEHVVVAREAGTVRSISVQVGNTVHANHSLAVVEPGAVDTQSAASASTVDLDRVRPDLADVIERQGKKLDENRPAAVARRRKTGQRTVRENVDHLVDDGTFIEYGALTIAARRMRMPMEELIDRTPADGLVCGIGQVNGNWFDESRARTMVVAYDYTVLAGTQGKKNHQKKDRMFELARQWRLPVVLLAEGGGGRPGDTDVMFGANLQVEAFHRFGKLSGLVPLVGIASGRCFAGNAVLLGCCDVIIATVNSTIGMGGPAMIEGGGLGVYTPEEVGPMSVQVPNGVVDVAVKDEAEAIVTAKKYLSYFQGPTPDWTAADQRELRHLVPENRLRVYDVRKVIETLADTDSVLELRAGFGHGIVTAFARIEGRPMGVIANNPAHLGGAIDSDASDKASRFMQLCDAFDIPILSLCDTPGNMVGPEHEQTALVRHCCRMFVIGANITVPLITVVLRKGYGLGAQGMAGGSFHAPLATLSWPTGEFGGMGLEGAVKLGFRDQLAAIEDPQERLEEYERRVAEMYEKGSAVSIASYFELDEVIDPEQSRFWIVSALKAVPPAEPRAGKKRTNIDTW